MHRNVAKSVELSLKNLGDGINYIDLLLLHCNSISKVADVAGPIAWKAEDDRITVAMSSNGKVHIHCLPETFSNRQPIRDTERSTDHSQTWKDMESLVNTGKVRSIGMTHEFGLTAGVSNFNISQLQNILKIAHVPPAVNQIEIHPFWP
jgi:diketogulonate reductase-like aldo/keto reductase